MAAISDVVIAVSDGVAESFRTCAPDNVFVVSNGCDFQAYNNPAVDPELERVAAGRRVIIYAGNINHRLDFELLKKVAAENSHALLVFFGAVAGLSKTDEAHWSALLQMPNIRYFGSVNPDRLPALYHAADVGLMPYKKTPLLVEDSFPLKTFEMIAAGLPVVATLMKPIARFSDRRAMAVVETKQEFLEAVSLMSRAKHSIDDSRLLNELAKRQDYTAKFAEVKRLLLARQHDVVSSPLSPFRAAAQADLLSMLDSRGLGWWRRMLEIGRFYCPDALKSVLKQCLTGFAKKPTGER